MKTPIEVNPRLQPLYDKMDEVAKLTSDTKREIKDVRTRTDVQKNPYNGNARNNRVSAILGFAAEEPRSADHIRLGELLTELNALNMATDELHALIRREEAKSSVAVCDSVRPENERLGKDFAKKLIALYESHAAYSTFIDSVSDVGVSIASLNPIFPTVLGSTRDHSGSYMHLFTELKDGGYITDKDIPKGLKLN